MQVQVIVEVSFNFVILHWIAQFFMDPLGSLYLLYVLLKAFVIFSYF